MVRWTGRWAPSLSIGKWILKNSLFDDCISEVIKYKCQLWDRNIGRRRFSSIPISHLMTIFHSHALLQILYNINLIIILLQSFASELFKLSNLT